MMKRILETERLLLREFVEDDAEEFFAFNGDPRVMRLTGEPPLSGVDEARAKLRAYPDYRRHGYGRWAVVIKSENRIVGFNGLKYLNDLEEVDLGYRFAYDDWGCGFATESSLAVVRYGFEVLALRRIIGLVLPENVASIRVLQKVGMSYTGMVRYCGERAERWSLSLDGWHELETEYTRSGNSTSQEAPD